MALIIFLCNESKWDEAREHFKEAKEQISKMIPYQGFWWTAGNTRQIQVGDKFLIQRTIKDPKGYFAAGKVIAAKKEYQLRLTDKNYSDLSDAYVDDFNEGSFRVALETHSIVNFDFPLEIKKLKLQRQFLGANFLFRSSGCEFKTEYANCLYSEWEKHSMELARKNFGIRIIDIFCNKAQELKNQKEYHSAVDFFEKALIFDPEYVKAKNGIKSCNLILERQSKVTSPDDIVQENTSVQKKDIATSNDDSEDAEVVSSEIQSEVFFGNPENNRRVEVAAINFVTKTYEGEGWVVTSVERDKVGFDLICKRGNERLDVEVKGLSGNRPQFIITVNELEQSKKINCLFYVLLPQHLWNLFYSDGQVMKCYKSLILSHWHTRQN
jgi:hypothetical protein